LTPAARKRTSGSASRQASTPQPAYVLHSHDWSESSLILELFTRQQGRITVVAKGAKRPYSQLRSVLLPFQQLLVQAAHKKGDEGAEVGTLRTAEWAGGPAMPSGSALLAAFYLNELLMKSVPRHDPQPALYDLYAGTLRCLDRDDDLQTQAALRAFELKLLREHGVLPALDRITQTQAPLAAAERYRLQPEIGLQPDDDEARPASPSGATWIALETALATDDLTALQQATRPALGGLRIQLRALLHQHLGTDRLRTRALMIDAQKLLPPPSP
jgi:DNA repair protein RecO (recombination protein O)